jgi:hypothetical protein
MFAWSNDLNARNSAAFSTDGGRTWTSAASRVRTAGRRWAAIPRVASMPSATCGGVVQLVVLQHPRSQQHQRRADVCQRGRDDYRQPRSTDDRVRPWPVTGPAGGGDHLQNASGSLVAAAGRRSRPWIGRRGGHSAALSDNFPAPSRRKLRRHRNRPQWQGRRLLPRTPADGSGASSFIPDFNIFGSSTNHRAPPFVQQSQLFSTNVGGFRPIPAQPSRTRRRRGGTGLRH